MKKFKIFLLVIYVLIVLVLIYEASIPGNISSKQHSFFKRLINNISKIFIKNKVVNPTDIKLNNELKEYYYTNETLSLDIEVIPSNSSYKTLTFTSLNKDILDIDEAGVITFISEGIGSIKIEQKDANIEKIITLKVKKYVEPIEELIEPTAVELRAVDNITSVAVGDFIKFYVLFDRDDVNDFEYEFTSSNTNVCKTAGEYIYALTSGSSTITYKHLTTELTSSLDITITDGIITEPNTLNIVGDSNILVSDKSVHTYKVEVDNSASNMYKIFKYYTLNNNLERDDSFMKIKEDSGVLEVKSHGIGYIVAYSMDLKYSVKYKVVISNIMPDFNLKDSRAILGDPYKVVINPTNKDDLTYDKYIYSSSDEGVATIDGLGNISTKKVGKTTITVTLDDGIDYIEKSFILTVDNKVIEDDIGSSFGKIIRKGIAHFLGFIVFGFVSFIMFIMWIKPNYDGNKKLILLLIGINGLVFAILTEAIQLVSPGRDGTIRDVLLDYFGYSISFIISLSILLVIYLITKKKNNNKKIITNDNLE